MATKIEKKAAAADELVRVLGVTGQRSSSREYQLFCEAIEQAEDDAAAPPPPPPPLVDPTPES